MGHGSEVHREGNKLSELMLLATRPFGILVPYLSSSLPPGTPRRQRRRVLCARLVDIKIQLDSPRAQCALLATSMTSLG